jgi:hypothetical protein
LPGGSQGTHTAARGAVANAQRVRVGGLSQQRTDPPDRSQQRRQPDGARTFILVTVAVLIVIYGALSQLHRLSARLLTTRAGS